MRLFLPMLILAGLALDAPVQYQFRTAVNPDRTLTVYQGDACPEGALIIPDTIDEQKVTGIGDYAFTGCFHLNSITIPDGVTSSM